MSGLFNQTPMKREAIVEAASKMGTTHDLLVLLNKIKMDDLGDKGHPFTMPQLNYFINPKRSTTSYITFTIPKKSGGFRTIDAPVRMLKSFQTYVNKILQAIYVAPDCVTGFAPTKSIIDNAERHIGRNYVFNTDLKDFFPSISQARVWGALKTTPFNFNEKVASAIAGLCCIAVSSEERDADKPNKVYNRFVLPQGSPCSPTLTNIVCQNLDRKLNGLARRFRLKYSRYADDITFSSNHNVFQEDGSFLKEFRRIISEQNFTINEKKTRLQKRGARQEVTGLVISDRVNVSREFVRDLDNLLYIWERHGRDSAFVKFMARYVPMHTPLINQIPRMETVVEGRLMYLRMVKGEDCPVWRRLQKRFNRLVNRKDSAAGTNIVYLHDYTIETFETTTGATIAFTPTPKTNSWGERNEPEVSAASQSPVIAPSFQLNGRSYIVTISKYARTRIRNIIKSGDPQLLKKFRKQFHIACCTYDSRPSEADCTDDIRFWMIYRGMSKKKGGTDSTVSKDGILPTASRNASDSGVLPEEKIPTAAQRA